MQPANLSAEEVAEGFLLLMLTKGGPAAVPEKYRKATLDLFWERYSHPETGFRFFLTWFGKLYVKGQRWQDFVPKCEKTGAPVPRIHPDTGKSWDWQLDVAAQIPLHEKLFILKSRQVGFSYVMCNYAEWCATRRAETPVAMIANRLQSAERNMRRVKNVHNRLPEWFREMVPLTNPAVRRMEYGNGSYIEPYSGDPDAARSEGAAHVLVDEAGEIDRLDEFWAATEAVADDGGQIVLFGTAKPNGIRHWCEEGAAGTVVGNIELDAYDADGVRSVVSRLPVYKSTSEVDFLFIPYYAHPARDEAWYEKRRKTYKRSLKEFDQEYPSTWEMAFIDAGLTYFEMKRMDAVRNELQAEVEGGMMLWEARDRRGSLLWDGDGRVKFVEDPYGHVVIHAKADEFAELLATGRPFVIGADCAGNRVTGEADSHAASALQIGHVPFTEQDLDSGRFDEIIPHRQLVTIHGRMDQDAYAELLVRLGTYLGTALLAIEANGVGIGVINGVKRRRYKAIFKRRTKPTKKGDKPTQEYGWWSGGNTASGSGTKHIAYGEYARCFHNGYLEIRDVGTVTEMRDVLHLGGGRIGAKDPKHDDRPDGLAICHGVLPYAGKYLPGIAASTEVEAPAFGTMEWLMARCDERLKNRGRDVLGLENAG